MVSTPVRPLMGGTCRRQQRGQIQTSQARPQHVVLAWHAGAVPHKVLRQPRARYRRPAHDIASANNATSALLCDFAAGACSTQFLLMPERLWQIVLGVNGLVVLFQWLKAHRACLVADDEIVRAIAVRMQPHDDRLAVFLGFVSRSGKTPQGCVLHVHGCTLCLCRGDCEQGCLAQPGTNSSKLRGRSVRPNITKLPPESSHRGEPRQ